jgi:hypothetical protein
MCYIGHIAAGHFVVCLHPRCCAEELHGTVAGAAGTAGPVILLLQMCVVIVIVLKNSDVPACLLLCCGTSWAGCCWRGRWAFFIVKWVIALLLCCMCGVVPAFMLQ